MVVTMVNAASMTTLLCCVHVCVRVHVCVYFLSHYALLQHTCPFTFMLGVTLNLFLWFQ